MPCSDQAAPSQRAGQGDRGGSGGARRPRAQRQQQRRERYQRNADRSRRGERGHGEAGGQPGGRDRAELVDAGTGRHSASRDRSDSSRTGPMPLTSSSSSIEPKPPCASR